jgi:TM2 domain-containing membrane protein YozV
MRTFILMLSLFFLTVLSVKAQNYEEVVYLKNGSIIRGTIIEQIPNQSIKIQTRDGNVFVYNMAEVEKLTKEPVNGRSYNNYNGNQNSFSNSKELKPGTAFLWSCLISGGGQFYNHQNVKGGIMLGIDILGEIGMISSLKHTSYAYYGSYNYSYSNTNLSTFFTCFTVVIINDIWSLIDAPVSANVINRRNGLSLNYQLNKNVNVTLKPDYKIDNYSGRYTPVIGAKLGFNLN